MHIILQCLMCIRFGESWSQCAARELKEETNLDFKETPILKATLNNVFRDSQKHYVTILYDCNLSSLMKNGRHHRQPG